MRWTLVATLIVAVVSISAATVQAQSASNLTINGYSSFEFEKQTEKEGNGDPNGSFDADLFDLVLNFQVSDAVRVSSDLTWEHGAATEDGFGNVAVEYAFVEYAFSDLLKLRVGKMFTPFGIFNEIHTAKPAFLSVKEPASTNKTERIVDDGFRFFPRWGAGIAVHGDGLIGDRNFSYDVFLANGDQSETNPFEEDNNTSKAVTARFRLEPSESIEIGNSFYYDKRDADGVSQITSDGLEIRYQARSWKMLAEATFGWLELAETDRILQIGWYVQPSYEFDNGMIPYVRLERVDPNTRVEDDHGYDFIAGLNYEVSGGFMVKIENNYYKGASASSRPPWFWGSDDDANEAQRHRRRALPCRPVPLDGVFLHDGGGRDSERRQDHRPSRSRRGQLEQGGALANLPRQEDVLGIGGPHLTVSARREIPCHRDLPRGEPEENGEAVPGLLEASPVLRSGNCPQDLLLVEAGGGFRGREPGRDRHRRRELQRRPSQGRRAPTVRERPCVFR
jgi:hypothetical protein